MMKKLNLSRIIVLFVFVIALTSTTAIGYSYFDSLIESRQESIDLGSWWEVGTPISTPQEFYDYLTKADSSSDDSYYLINDIDFQGFDWEFTTALNNVIFRGSLDGKGYTVSNLTIYTNSTRMRYFGLFARIEGATITNLVFDKVNLELGTSALYYSNMRSGLIAGGTTNSTNTISNITIKDSGVRGTSSYGTGGLIGLVYGSSSVLNINNIKTNRLKVFTRNYYAGGLVGNIYTSGAEVNISDIDFKGEVFAYTSNVGGLVGRVRKGCSLDIDRAIIELSTQNTLETNSRYNIPYSGRHLGGVIGLNQSSDITVNDVFFTGVLVPFSTAYSRYVGTLIGRNTGSFSATDVYYSQVIFLDALGYFSYTPNSPRGAMSTLVDKSNMPSLQWWNDFANSFDTENIWSQNNTGRLILN